MNQSFFEKIFNHPTEQDFFPLFFEDENVNKLTQITNDPDLLQINTESSPQLDFPPKLITRASVVNRPIDHKVDEYCSEYSMATEKLYVKESHLKRKQPFSNPVKKDNTKTTGSIPHDEVTAIPPQTRSILIQKFRIPLEVPKKPFEAILIYKIIQMYLKICVRG